MADVVDDFGRVTRLAADFESLSESLRSAVGKAVEYATGKAKESKDDLKEEFEKLVEAMEELGEDVKDSLKSTKDFVEEVKKAAESVEKARASKPAGGRDTLADAQREQTRILQQILAAQQKAVSEKAAKFTTGGTALSSSVKRRPALKEMGFMPRGADKIPAMVSPGEFVVSKRGAMGNEPLLDRINRGYVRGGKVKPEYLASGSTKGVWEGMAYEIINRSGRKVILIDGVLDKESAERLREDFAHLGDKISVEFAESFNDRLRDTAAVWFTSMAAAFTGRGDPFQVLFEGVVKDITDFRREMRNLAFQTEGITGNFREAQAEFARIGKDIAGRTGVTVTAFQKAYMNNARKGFKDQKAGMKVLESGLKLSTLIGSETQAPATLFADWHRELGLGATQMGRMANNMQMVARSTGVTGDELIGVMKSSEQILKSLRNQGTLTTAAARNVTQAMAEYKKSGFEEEGQKMLGAMTGYSAFSSADKGTKTLLQIAAGRGGVDQMEMMSGTALQDQEKMGNLGEGLRDFLAQQAGFKPEDYHKFDMDLIDEKQRRHLTFVLGSMGKSIGEVDATLKNFEKTAKGLGGELSDLEKASKDAAATQEQRDQAEKKMNDTLLAASMNNLGGVINAAEKFSDKGMSGLAEELTKSHKYGTDFQGGVKDMAAMAPHLSDAVKKQFGLSGTAEDMSQKISKMDAKSQIKLMSMASADQLDKVMAAAGKSDKDFASRMQKAMASDDVKMMKSIGEEMATAQSELQINDAANVDPMEALEQSMNKLNETIRSAFSPLTGAVLDLIGWIGLVGIQIGLMGGALSKFFGGSFVQLLAGGGPGGGLVSALDKYARKTATSSDVSEGIFKKFFAKYTDSRKPTKSFMDVAEWRKLRKQGVSAIDAKRQVEKMGGFRKSKGVFGSLNDAFGGVRDDMMKGMSKMRGATVEFFQAAYQNSGRFFSAFTKGFSRGLKSGGGFFSSIQKGFSTSMKSFDFTRGILHKMGDGLKLVNGKYVQTLASIRKTSPALAGFVRN
jgi:ABC-type transporter Mla subunit MlaD